MSNVKKYFIWIAILLLAGLLRFYKLGELPSGLTWDEAAIAYNGYSIVKVHRDEWLQLMPISFKSFGDFKAPLAIYINGAVTYLLGITTWSIRLPFALLGVMAVLGMMLMVEQIYLLDKKRQKTRLNFKTAGIISGVLLALSPWHILFSRVGFESGLALALLIWGVFFLLKWQQSSKYKILWLLLSASLLTSTLYAYHSAKVAMPLLVMSVMWWFYKKQILKNRYTLVFFLSMLILSYPVLYDSFAGEGLTRAGVTIFAQTGYTLQTFKTFISNTSSHLSPGFLIKGVADSLRHSTGRWGVLLPTSFILWVLGVWQVIQSYIFETKENKDKTKLSVYLALSFTIFGLLPAIIGQEVPHPNRALLALPGFILFILLGIEHVEVILGNYQKKIKLLIYSLLILLYGTSFVAFAGYYLNSYGQKTSQEFIAGYLETAELAWQYLEGKDDYPPVDQVVMTSQYGQPYIYVLLAGEINPISYHAGALVQFLFLDEVTTGDLSRDNALIIAKPGTFGLQAARATQVIYDDYGREQFWLFVTEDKSI
jgi:hypothetical protein